MDDLALPRRPVRDAPDRLYGFAPSPISIRILRKHERQAARPPPSFLSPLATILSELSASGLCSLSAASAGAFIQTSISSRVVRTTGIAFGWIAPTSLFGSVVRNAEDVVCRLAFLYFPDRGPTRPDARKEGQWPGILEGEPNRRTGAVRQDVIL